MLYRLEPAKTPLLRYLLTSQQVRSTKFFRSRKLWSSWASLRSLCCRNFVVGYGILSWNMSRVRTFYFLTGRERRYPPAIAYLQGSSGILPASLHCLSPPKTQHRMSPQIPNIQVVVVVMPLPGPGSVGQTAPRSSPPAKEDSQVLG